MSRGLAVGDLFNDGRMDAVVNNLDGAPSLFRNLVKNSNHFIAFQLVGGPKSPRDAVGASVYVTADGFTQRADILAGGSFASSPDQRPHFGLGASTTIQKIEIHWPDGLRQEVAPPTEVDGFYRVVEGMTAERMKR